MSIKPILFNTEMVKAIQVGRKTQTRRIAFVADALREFSCASYPDGWWYKGRVYKSFESFVRDCQTPKCKYRPGDILWVRETWHKDAGRYMYKANYAGGERFYRNGQEVSIHWHPSIHMPKEAARIFLRVKDVRVELLREISASDAMDEGFADWNEFVTLWNTTIKPADLDKYGWNANPWVWVIEFERCEKPEGWC